MSRSVQRSGRTISRQMRDGSPFRRLTTGQVVRREESTSSEARGSMLTNRISPSGISGSPISSAAARARESNENSASCASAAASSSPPRTSTAPSLPRISASRPNGSPVVMSTIGWKCGRIRPCERNSGNQSVRARSSSVSAGSGSACSSPSRTANMQARSVWESDCSSVLSRSTQPGPASLSPSTAMSPSAGSVARCSTL